MEAQHMKPNFSLLARELQTDRRTVKKYYNGFTKSGSLSNRVDETILVKELSSVRLLNSFFSCWSKKFRH